MRNDGQPILPLDNHFGLAKRIFKVLGLAFVHLVFVGIEQR